VVKDPPKADPPPEADEANRVGNVTSEEPVDAKSDRPALDDGVPVAIELEGPPFEYAYYLKAVREKIARSWTRPPLAGETLAVKVRFRIERDGRILDESVLEPSGNAMLDTSALRALLKASPLPPLPSGYPEPWLGIRLQFVIEE
jgi:TonB family protein